MNKINRLLLILIAYTITIAIFSFIVPINFFTSILLWYAFPSFYLSLRIPNQAKKSLIFSLLVLPLMIIIDYISHVTKTWLVPYSILPMRLFGFVTLEIILWSFFYVYYVTVLFEYQQNEKKGNIWHYRMNHLIALMTIFSIAFLILLYTKPELLNIPYFYLIFGTIFVGMPIVTTFMKYPSWFSKIYRIMVFSSIISTIYEVSALKAGWWAFLGTQYIALVSFPGVQFSLEELIFWILLLAPATIIAYEFFHGRGKSIISIDTFKFHQ